MFCGIVMFVKELQLKNVVLPILTSLLHFSKDIVAKESQEKKTILLIVKRLLLEVKNTEVNDLQ